MVTRGAATISEDFALSTFYDNFEGSSLDTAKSGINIGIPKKLRLRMGEAILVAAASSGEFSLSIHC